MTIRPVDFATIQRTDDVGAMKHRQDTKPVQQSLKRVPRSVTKPV